MKPLPGQRPLFDEPSAMPQYDSVPLNPTVPEHDRPRLSAQHTAILDRLAQGPATGPQLAAIAIRYSARLEELRKAGFRWDKRPHGGGQFRYFLIDDE